MEERLAEEEKKLLEQFDASVEKNINGMNSSINKNKCKAWKKLKWYN